MSEGYENNPYVLENITFTPINNHVVRALNAQKSNRVCVVEISISSGFSDEMFPASTWTTIGNISVPPKNGLAVPLVNTNNGSNTGIARINTNGSIEVYVPVASKAVGFEFVYLV